MAFGKANRPQTPVGGIIKNNYGEEGELNQIAKYAEFMAMVSDNSFDRYNDFSYWVSWNLNVYRFSFVFLWIIEALGQGYDQHSHD